MTTDPAARVSVVLHAHLPFVRHPENEFHLEELWFFEAMHETYLPLIRALRRLERDGVSGRLTLSLSIPLLTMLDDRLLRERFERHLDRMIVFAGEAEDRLSDGRVASVAGYYRGRLRALRELWIDELDRDALGEFVRLEEVGRLELIACAGTHGLFPLMATDASRRAHVRAARRDFERRVGHPPVGMWLPECAYAPGVERALADEGIAYSFSEGWAIEQSHPPAVAGNRRPIVSTEDVAFFGRDRRSGARVWSADEGYPGDPVYREFYRDLRYELPELAEEVFGAPAGMTFDTGLKCHRVTGDVALDDKAPYEPDRARHRTVDHARDFVRGRVADGRSAAEHLDGECPHITCAYDAELFGHWWFEGPRFLESVVRTAAQTDELALTTPGRFLRGVGSLQRADPAPSTWGKNGDFSVWVDESNAWLQRHLRNAERAVVEAASALDESDGDEGRVLEQAIRELMMAQASDWPFILEGGTSVEYAVERLEDHLDNVDRLLTMLGDGPIDDRLLDDLERRHPLFPGLDGSTWAQAAS
ncbi:MAG: glycoside hydrolase family 57 protein [Bradymonadaceae bacterium]